MNEETSANTVVVIEQCHGAVVQRIVGEWVAALPGLPAHRRLTAEQLGGALRRCALVACWRRVLPVRSLRSRRGLRRRVQPLQILCRVTNKGRTRCLDAPS